MGGGGVGSLGGGVGSLGTGGITSDASHTKHEILAIHTSTNHTLTHTTQLVTHSQLNYSLAHSVTIIIMVHISQCAL